MFAPPPNNLLVPKSLPPHVLENSSILLTLPIFLDVAFSVLTSYVEFVLTMTSLVLLSVVVGKCVTGCSAFGDQ